MRLKHVPETNSFGLVLPPSPVDLEYLRFFQRPKLRPQPIDRHHLYWPRQLYNSNELAKRFREHRFNEVWILQRDHKAIHNQFDGVPIPSAEVMHAYLEEAQLLDDLGVGMEAIRKIDTAIYNGEVHYIETAENHRQQWLETIGSTIQRVNRFEVIPVQLAELVVKQLVGLPEAA